MKKIILIITIFIFLFIPVLKNNNTEASNGNSQLQLKNEQIKEKSKEFKNHELIYQMIILPNDHYQVHDALDMIENISKIHPTILQKVVDNNIKLKLFTGPLTDQDGFKHLKGIKPRGYVSYTWDDVVGAGGSKVALAKVGHSEKGKGHNSINLEIHELAHSVDKHVFNSIRDDQYFLEIWKSEADDLFPGQLYFINYPEEYFAEVFAMYYLSFFTKAELYIHAPQTYQYIKNLEEMEPSSTQLVISFP